VNALNYSAAVIPVTKADKSVDTVDATYKPINDLDRKNWDACKYSHRWNWLVRHTANENATSADDPEIYDGAPVGIQIVARKFEEEKVLAIAKIVYAALLKSAL
jgi:amidase